MRTITARDFPEVIYKSANPEGDKTPMADADQLSKFCAICKLPIEPHQRPSVTLGKGKEAHLECYVKSREGEQKPPS